MGLGVFLVPTLVGYWFLTHLHYTRFRVVRGFGYHVLFQAGIAGLVLFAIAHMTILFVNRCVPQITTKWESYISIPYSDSLVLTAIFGLVLPLIGNWFYDAEKSARVAAIRNGNLIELLISESIYDQHLVELSLRSGKSYIGLALQSGRERHGDSDVELVPLVSGYRDIDTQELVITTNYSEAIEQSLESESIRYEDFRVVVPRLEIISARIFDPDAYQLFQQIGLDWMVPPPSRRQAEAQTRRHKRRGRVRTR